MSPVCLAPPPMFWSLCPPVDISLSWPSLSLLILLQKVLCFRQNRPLTIFETSYCFSCLYLWLIMSFLCLGYPVPGSIKSPSSEKSHLLTCSEPFQLIPLPLGSALQSHFLLKGRNWWIMFEPHESFF